jgi:hypothetical protein
VNKLSVEYIAFDMVSRTPVTSTLLHEGMELFKRERCDLNSALCYKYTSDRLPVTPLSDTSTRGGIQGHSDQRTNALTHLYPARYRQQDREHRWSLTRPPHWTCLGIETSSIQLGVDFVRRSLANRQYVGFGVLAVILRFVGVR